MNEIHNILSSLNYQYPVGIVTMSPCSTGCGKPARGGRECKDCLGDNMEKFGVSKVSVYLLQSKLKKLQELQYSIEDLKDQIIKETKCHTSQ